MSNIREEVQQKAMNAFLNSDGIGIIKLAVRTGKCRLTLNIMKELDLRRVLVVYPQVKIEDSWRDEVKKIGYSPESLEFSTYMSLEKLLGESYDMVVFDECDDTSDRQREAMAQIIADHTNVLGLTGTLNHEDKAGLADIGLKVIHEYTVEDGINDGILPPYHIHVIRCPLDNKEPVFTNKKGKKQTEKQKFDAYTWIIAKLKEDGKDTFHMNLARARMLCDLPSRLTRCKKLLTQLGSKKVLFFGGSQAFVEKLGIPTFHSKTKDKTPYHDFLSGNIDKLGVVAMLKSGVTIENLDVVVISRIEGNSSKLEQQLGRAMLFSYKEKISKLILITSGEPSETKRLNKALANFNKHNITYGS